MLANSVNRQNFKLSKQDIGSFLMQKEFKYFQSLVKKLLIEAHDHFTHCVTHELEFFLIVRVAFFVSR